MSPNSNPFSNSHMSYMGDIRPCVKKDMTIYCKNSMMDIINKNPDFSKFRYIIKLAGLDLMYDDIEANFTLFVPSDRVLAHIPEGVFLNMDIGTARNIVRTSSLKNKITYELLSDSPASYFLTLNNSEKLFVMNVNGGTTINNCICLLFADILACNGVIHVTNDLIFPHPFA